MWGSTKHRQEKMLITGHGLVKIFTVFCSLFFEFEELQIYFRLTKAPSITMFNITHILFKKALKIRLPCVNLDPFCKLMKNSLWLKRKTILFVKLVFITEANHLHKRMKWSKAEVNQSWPNTCKNAKPQILTNSYKLIHSLHEKLWNNIIISMVSLRKCISQWQNWKTNLTALPYILHANTAGLEIWVIWASTLYSSFLREFLFVSCI